MVHHKVSSIPLSPLVSGSSGELARSVAGELSFAALLAENSSEVSTEERQVLLKNRVRRK